MARASRTGIAVSLIALAGVRSSASHAQEGGAAGVVVASDVFGNVHPISG